MTASSHLGLNDADTSIIVTSNGRKRFWFTTLIQTLNKGDHSNLWIIANNYSLAANDQRICSGVQICWSLNTCSLEALLCRCMSFKNCSLTMQFVKCHLKRCVCVSRLSSGLSVDDRNWCSLNDLFLVGMDVNGTFA